MTWQSIYDTIIARLGAGAAEWDGGLDFDTNAMIIHHRDKKQKVRVGLYNIAICQPGIAGGWFSAILKLRNGT